MLWGSGSESRFELQRVHRHLHVKKVFIMVKKSGVVLFSLAGCKLNWKHSISAKTRPESLKSMNHIYLNQIKEGGLRN